MVAVYIDNMCAEFDNDQFIPFNTLGLTKRIKNAKVAPQNK